jgi:hypothetical protein
MNVFLSVAKISEEIKLALNRHILADKCDDASHHGFGRLRERCDHPDCIVTTVLKK